MENEETPTTDSGIDFAGAALTYVKKGFLKAFKEIADKSENKIDDKVFVLLDAFLNKDLGDVLVEISKMTENEVDDKIAEIANDLIDKMK